MIVYNVTMKVDWSIADAWLAWMQDVYIPEILGTGYFTMHQFVRLLEVDDKDGPTYAVQYFTNSMHTYQHYLHTYATAFSNQLIQQWGDKCLSFATLMEFVH